MHARAGDTSQPLVASCAGDCEVRLHDVASGAVVKVYSPHTGVQQQQQQRTESR